MKEHLKDVIDCSADTITVFNGNGQIKMFNKAAIDIYGYSESEILNESIEIFFEIIQMIIINRRGRIWVDTQAQKGARFYIGLLISGDLA